MSEDQTGSADTTASTDSATNAEVDPQPQGQDRDPSSARKQQSPQAGKDATAPEVETDSTDWKSEARKHESRAKANRSAAEKAAEEKAVAEQAKDAAEAKTVDLLDGIAKVLGVKSDDEPPDPAKLQQTITDRESRVSSLEQTVTAKDEELAGRDRTIAAKDIELAAWRAAVAQGVDALTLMDLRSTERRLGQLDPAADDFTAQLESVIKEIAKDNPALRVQTREVGARDAGIGASGSKAPVMTKPGTPRMRAAYGNNP